MKVSVEWINHFLEKKLTAKQMADAMELAAIEVEEIVESSNFDQKIVVGEVLEVTEHPNADKLRLATVDVGNSTVLEIVCGAPNLEPGQKVPVARIGAILPNGFEIKKSKIRGVNSNGMICSEAELEISDDHEGIMVLPEKAKIGSKLVDLITSGEVIDVKTPANRWDLNSVIGIAREVASQSAQKLTHDYPEQKYNSGNDFEASVESKDIAPSYVLARLKVDLSKPSPAWLTSRLKDSGIRPISVVVDITNYIMLEYGQPLHAFDASKIDGPIRVRKAVQGEKLTTLDGVTRKLTPEDIVIADQSKVVGYAGVMGGENSEIDENTTEIFLEAASFHAASLRKTAIRNGLRTDASARFERGLPNNLQLIALGGSGGSNKGAIDLLVELAGGELLGVKTISKPDPVTQITADSSRISRLLGIELSAQKVSKELQKLSFVAQAGSASEVRVQVPWWRSDVAMEADIAEEVIKLVGYEALPSTIPSWRPRRINFDSHWSKIWQMKSVLMSLGLFEVSTYSFISPQHIEGVGWDLEGHLKLKNPLSSEQAYLRSSLFPSLLSTAAKNRNYSKNYGMFELSKLFHKTQKGQLPHESPYLGIIMVQEKDAYRRIKAAIDRLAADFNVDLQVEPFVFDPKIAHPSRAAEIVINGERRGIIGQLHPELTAKNKINGEVGYLELDWEAFVGASKPKTSHALSRFPEISRDISVELDAAIPWVEVARELSDYKVEFISDYYGRGVSKNKKSLTLRLTFGSNERTLTDKEADKLAQKALEILKNKFGAQLR